MTERQFQKFKELFERVFNLNGRWGYDEGDGFTVSIQLLRNTSHGEKIYISGEGSGFCTPELKVGSMDFDFTGENVYFEFRDESGKCLWFIRGEKKDITRDYERLLFLCEEYNEE